MNEPDQIVQCIREAAVEYSNCRLNMARANRIMNEKLRPSYKALRSRGDPALRKLLPLLEDDNATVRWVAAGFAYDLEPERCRQVLEQAMHEPGVTGIMAWAALAERNLDAPPPFPSSGSAHRDRGRKA